MEPIKASEKTIMHLFVQNERVIRGTFLKGREAELKGAEFKLKGITIKVALPTLHD